MVEARGAPSRSQSRPTRLTDHGLLVGCCSRMAWRGVACRVNLRFSSGGGRTCEKFINSYPTSVKATTLRRTRAVEERAWVNVHVSAIQSLRLACPRHAQSHGCFGNMPNAGHRAGQKVIPQASGMGRISQFLPSRIVGMWREYRESNPTPISGHPSARFCFVPNRIL